MNFLARHLVALAAVAAIGLGVPAGASARQIAFGAYTPDALSDGGAGADAFADKIGRKPVVIHWYRNWDEDLIVPRDLHDVAGRDALPLITWEPYGHALHSISGGSYDGYIRQSARDAAAAGSPMFVRYAHEMNGDWFPWGLGANGNSAGDYVAAWRHVVRIFHQEGASNVRFTWCPNTGKFDSLYPGDDYVDWLCLDGYNWGAKWDVWDSWDEVFGDSYRSITRLSRKPLMIAETGVNEQGGDKAAWIRKSFSEDTMSRYPRLRAVLLFNKDQDGAVWRIDSSSDALKAYRAVFSSPLFGLDAKSLLDSAPGSDEPVPTDTSDLTAQARPPVTGARGPRCGLRRGRVLDLRPSWDVSVPIRCNRAATGTCRGTIVLRRGRSGVLGRARVDLHDGLRQDVITGVPGWAKSSLRSRSRLRVRVTLRTGSGCRGSSGRRVKLVRR
ncbi:MAG TPA: glycosyl hydrolase [Thermoleophilaceae bacterium]